MQLAGFFKVVDETRDPAFRRILEQRTNDPEAGVRTAAHVALGDRVPVHVASDPKRADAMTPVRPRARAAGLGPPSLATFRERINPLFYQAGEDGYSCADCHGNHTILRIAPADAAKSGEDTVTVNYRSALRAIDLEQPETSLLLRKATSPLGQGEADPSSPTGLTHIGGPRWSGADHPAYRAILDWIQGSPDPR